MKYSSLVPLILMLAFPACPGPGPGPDPTPPPPTPPPAPPIEMLLRRDGPQLVTLGGAPVELFGAIPCCRALEPLTESPPAAPRPLPVLMEGEEVLTGWPVAVAPGWRAYVASQVDSADPVFYHARLGPFFGRATAEPEWADVGGGHQVAPGGLAILPAFNSAFWDLVQGWVRDACLAGDYVEIDLIDRWWAKQTVIPNPMQANWNTQGYDWQSHVGRAVILPGSPEDLWLEQIVKTLGPLPCVIWEDGNEVGLGPYDVQWTESMQARIRHHEHTVGQGIVHLFGTNSGRAAAEASAAVDYIERHQGLPISAPIHDKPSFVNEYNPSPPFSPTEVHERFCLARRSGTGWWYWRHTQTMEEMSATLGLLAGGCDTPPPATCTLGTPTASEAVAAGQSPTLKVKASGRGLDTTPFARFGQAYCAAAGWTDGRSACAVAPDGHPQRRACEIHFTGSQCPRWKGDCTGSGWPECPITFDTLIGDDPHPINANAQCPSPHPNHQERPEVFWARPEGRGWVFACNHDYTVCGMFKDEIDQ